MQIFNKSFFLLLLILIAISLSGCRVILFSEDSPPFVKEMGKQRVHLEAKAIVRSASIIIRSETTFPPGTIFDVELKPYPEDATAFQVETYSVAPLKENAVSSTLTVNEKGELEGIVIDRPDINTRYRIQITFNPASQPKEVVNILGSNGERMEIETGVERLENSDTFVYRKAVNIMKKSEPFGIGAKLDFVPLK
jgi:hypothetical protein